MISAVQTNTVGAEGGAAPSVSGVEKSGAQTPGGMDVDQIFNIILMQDIVSIAMSTADGTQPSTTLLNI